MCSGKTPNTMELKEPTTPLEAALPTHNVAPEPEESIANLAKRYEHEAARLLMAETTLKYGREDVARFEKNYEEAKEVAGQLASKLAARLGLPVK